MQSISSSVINRWLPQEKKFSGKVLKLMADYIMWCFVQASTVEDAEKDIQTTVIGIYKVQTGDFAKPDVGVMIEGCKVLNNQQCEILGFIMLFGIIYSCARCRAQGQTLDVQRGGAIGNI